MPRFTQEALIVALQDAALQVEVGARYAHYKNPSQHYVLTQLVVLEATEEVGVVYQAQYGDGISFVRSLENFLSIVERGGEQVARFKKITIA